MRDEWYNDDFIDDDGWRFEENDDERTWGNELTPDCEEVPFDNELPFPEQEISPVLEYVAEFKALIDACGCVSYYFNMKKYVAAEVSKAKIVAAAYSHDLRYYEDQLSEWKVKADIAFGALAVQAARLGYTMPKKKLFLNMLALYKDRREAYKGYLQTCLKKDQALSPIGLELKYQKLLRKRMKK